MEKLIYTVKAGHESMPKFLPAHRQRHDGLAAGGLSAGVFDGDLQVDAALVLHRLFVDDPGAAGERVPGVAVLHHAERPQFFNPPVEPDPPWLRFRVLDIISR